jgi:hypothetical protein
MRRPCLVEQPSAVRWKLLRIERPGLPFAPRHSDTPSSGCLLDAKAEASPPEARTVRRHPDEKPTVAARFLWSGVISTRISTSTNTPSHCTIVLEARFVQRFFGKPSFRQPGNATRCPPINLWELLTRAEREGGAQCAQYEEWNGRLRQRAKWGRAARHARRPQPYAIAVSMRVCRSLTDDPRRGGERSTAGLELERGRGISATQDTSRTLRAAWRSMR